MAVSCLLLNVRGTHAIRSAIMPNIVDCLELEVAEDQSTKRTISKFI